MEHEVAISQLRDVLGVAYLHVARANEPVIVARYGRADVAMVPLWEWRWFKQIEEATLHIQPARFCPRRLVRFSGRFQG